MILQLVGLPCSGKTYVLNRIKEFNKGITILDLKNYSGFSKEKRMIKDLNSTSFKESLIILESACGLENLDSIVIMLRVSNSVLKFNQKKRKEFLCSQTKYQIIDQMLPPTYTVYDIDSCETLIKTIIKTEFPNVSNAKTASYSKHDSKFV